MDSFTLGSLNRYPVVLPHYFLCIKWFLLALYLFALNVQNISLLIPFTLFPFLVYAQVTHFLVLFNVLSDLGEYSGFKVRQFLVINSLCPVEEYVVRFLFGDGMNSIIIAVYNSSEFFQGIVANDSIEGPKSGKHIKGDNLVVA